MRVLVTGGGGLLGSALIRGAPQGVEVHATRRSSPVEGAEAHAVDLADGPAVEALFDRVAPALVIHTAVASAAAGERDIWRATRNVADACRRAGAALVHLSTDALFDGERAPYAEHDEPAPVHEYGRWKAKAERYVREALPAAAVARTSLIVRADPPDKVSAWLLEALRRGEPVGLFVDELRCPVEVGELAAQLWEVAALAPERRAGVWHLVGPEAVSRFALGLLLAHRHRLDASLVRPRLNRSLAEPRPRDLRLLTTRADRELRTRARPVSEVLFPPAPGS